ncbi:MAG: TolC family protein [Akkermansiaceae bacterium]|nr:TolC family protein [Akkermansiaceae bacterium]
MSKFYQIIGFSLATTCLPLSAESTLVISLSSVGKRIQTQNPDLAAARLRIEEATGRMNQSGRLKNPELEAAAEQNSAFRGWRLQVGLSQRFPLTARLRLEREVSLSDVKSSEAEVQEIQRQLVCQARIAVVKILSGRQHRDLLKQQMEASEKFAEFVSAMASKGEGSLIDAGQANLDAARVRIEIRQLDVEEVALIGEIKPLLGMSSGEALNVSGILTEPTNSNSAEKWASRPDLQAAKINALAAASSLSLEKARRYEDVEGGIFIGAERLEDEPIGYTNDTMIGLQLKIPLPLWNKNEGAIQEAEAKKIRKEMEVIATTRNVHLEAEATLAEMQEWAKIVGEISNTLLPLADEQVVLAENAFRAGQGEIRSVLTPREQRIKLATTRLEALRQYHIARVRHESAIGQL